MLTSTLKRFNNQRQPWMPWWVWQILQRIEGEDRSKRFLRWAWRRYGR